MHALLAMDVGVSVIDYLIVGCYLAGMLGIGWLVTSKIRDFKDYFLAGGTLTTPLLVCTLVSTYYELDVTFSTSEAAFDYGVMAWFWYSRPYYIAIFIAAFLIVTKLRVHNFSSLPDVLGHHYGRGAQVAGALACFVYSLPIIALAGLATMFEVMGWPREIGLITAAGVCAVYTFMGGLWADAISDTVQFVLMCVSLAVAIPIAAKLVGGYGFVDTLPAEHMSPTGGKSIWLLLSWCAMALTIFVEPAFYQRIFAARSDRDVRNALILGLFLWAAYDWGVVFIGLAARSAVEQGLLPGALEGKAALITLCLQTLPIGLKGFFIGGILAAAMSSVDSYSLLASSNLVYDIYRPLFHPRITDAQLMRATRLGVLFVIALGVIVADFFTSLVDAWEFMASTLAAVAFVPVMGALYFRAKPLAGTLSAAAGLVALVAYYLFLTQAGTWSDEEETFVYYLGAFELWWEYAVLFALACSAIAFFIGQGLGRRPPRAPEAADVTPVQPDSGAYDHRAHAARRATGGPV